MSKKVAVIASILKPVNDTRLYEKLGLSMRESNKYQVNIIGFGVKNSPSQPDMIFHSLYHGPRISFNRLVAPVKFLFKLFKLKPSLIVVCTPELLLPASLYKTLATTALWYDVQENYQRNIRYQSSYPRLFKPILRLAIWLMETASSPFIDHYLLAEKGYASELPFVNNKHTILENKYCEVTIKPQPTNQHKTRFVFTGTISRENGIIEAISLVQALNNAQYPSELIIVGQVPNRELLRQIEQLINSSDHNLIKLVGNNELVSHRTIMEHAAAADFGLVAHQPNPSTENCIPTKIYEYLGLQLPMLLQKHTVWEEVVAPYQAAFILDYHNYHVETIVRKIKELKFYSVKPGPEISWNQESEKLLALL